MCEDRTRARYMPRRSASVGQQRRAGGAVRPKSAPFRTIAETHGDLNIHEYIGAVMKRYDDKKKAPEVKHKRRQAVPKVPDVTGTPDSVDSWFRDVAAVVKEHNRGAFDQEFGNYACTPSEKTEFMWMMGRFGLPLEMYGKDKAKSLSELWAEMMKPKDKAKTKFEARVLPDGKVELLRSAAVVVVELCTELDGKDVFLLLKYTFTDDGSQTRWDLNTRITKKMWTSEEPEKATWHCLSDNLSLTECICKENFEIESHKVIEEESMSEGFPGLLTRYTLHVARVRMHNKCMPTSQEFMTKVQGTGANAGSKRVWTWCSRPHFESLFPPTLDA